MEAKKIVFFGSSRFSISSLKVFLSDERFEIVAIVTGTDKPANRGQKIAQNVVADEAVKMGFDVEKIIKVKSLKNKEIKEKILSLDFDLGVVVSFGFIITEDIINHPKFGLINLHPAKLPEFRGAAPIQRSIEKNYEIDICIIDVVKELDAGDILLKKSFQRNQNESALDVIPKLAEEGSLLLRDCALNIQKFIEKKVKQVGEIGYANKIQTSELRTNFEEDANTIVNKIKAFNLDGCCYFFINNERVKVIDANFIQEDHKNKIPSILKNKLYAKNGVIELIKIQREGKKAMAAKDALMGMKIDKID